MNLNETDTLQIYKNGFFSCQKKPRCEKDNLVSASSLLCLLYKNQIYNVLKTSISRGTTIKSIESRDLSLFIKLAVIPVIPGSPIGDL